MPAKQYSVMLEQDQRESLIGLISTGNQASAKTSPRPRDPQTRGSGMETKPEKSTRCHCPLAVYH